MKVPETDKMIELLRLIFDKIDLLKVIQAARDARKTELARELFLIVVYANDIVIAARQIFSALESVCVLRGGTKDSARERAAKLLREQYFSLRKLDHALEKVRTEMNMIDPSLFRKLTELHFAKFSLIREVEDLCSAGNILIIDDISKCIRKKTTIVYNIRDANGVREFIGGLFANRRDYIDAAFEAQRYLRDKSVNLDQSLNDTQIGSIRTYLERSNPKQMIEELALTVDSIQRKLSEHFSLSDVLLNMQNKK